jgi:hypothetical protein
MMIKLIKAGRPTNAAVRPLSCHSSEPDFDRGSVPGASFQDCLNRWRVEHLERDSSFRIRVLRAADLIE